MTESKVADTSPDEATILERALLLRQSLSEDIRPSTLRDTEDLAQLLRVRGAWLRAAAWRREAVRGWTVIRGPADPWTLVAMTNLAFALVGSKRFEEAADVFQEVFTARSEALGADHPDTVRAMAFLADA